MNKAKLKFLQQIVQDSSVDIVPKGWFSSAEYGEKINRCHKTAQRMLAKLKRLRPDIVKEKVFTVRVNGRIYPIKHYYVKSEKSKQSRTKRKR